MIYVSRWSTIFVLATILLSALFAMPNALPQAARDSLPGWLPNVPVSLGLDLQGGSYLLLEIDLEGVSREKVDTLRADIRAGLRRVRIGYTGLEGRGNTVTLQISDPARVAEARTLINQLTNPGGLLLGLTTTEYTVSENNGAITIGLNDAYLRQFRAQIVGQSIEVVRRRIDELGTKEPTIQAQGVDRILVQVPGVSDPAQLISILSTTARMNFRLVDENGDIQAALQGRVPVEDELLYDDSFTGTPTPVLIHRRIMVAGERLVQASQGFDQRTNQPVVNFRFDNRGARDFGTVTRTNVGRRFAIVLDNKVISAPVISEPILGGSGQISGNFSVQTANDLAILLNAGALPADLRVIEERTVGAELGADSVNAGGRASIVGLAAVVVFMIASYGLFGVFAAIGLSVNMVVLIAVLTALQATLTLPGIAGMVLTMGMAVDSNVLIYERVREELAGGKSPISAIDIGFRRAMTAIIDSNLTTLLAALILFQLGSGPVRGFAVTLGLGIITSFFSAIMVNRSIIVVWLKRSRGKALNL